MVEALRAEYRLCEILPVVGMAKSSYEYAGNAQAKGETEERAAARKAVRRGVRGRRRHMRPQAHRRRGRRRRSGRSRHHEGRGPGRPRRQEEAALQLLRERGLRGAPEPAARRGGQAPLRGRRAQQAVDHRRDRVPRPRWQGVPLAHRGLPRRHAAELVGIGLARCRDGELAPDRRVRVAQRRGPPHGALG